MPLDFPSSPTTNQTYLGTNGTIYVWNGSVWVSQGTPLSQPAMVLIERWTSVGGETSKTFSALGAYTDLILIFSGRISDLSRDIFVYLNGDTTGANYRSRKQATASSNNYSDAPRIHCGEASAAASPASMWGEALIPNYAGATFQKRISTRFAYNYSAGGVEIGVTEGLWLNTAAITTVSCNVSGGGTYVAGSQISLFGRI